MSEAMKARPGAEHEMIYEVLSFWAESLLYGMAQKKSRVYPLTLLTIGESIGAYFILFIQAMNGFARRGLKSAPRVFMFGMILMFILTTCSIVLRSYILAISFGMQPDPRSVLANLRDYRRWDLLTHSALVSCLIWAGEFLAIYRCFVVWGRNWYIIIVPTALFLSTIARGIYTLHWFAAPSMDTLKTQLLLLRMCYPFNLAQNVITTSLIAYKVWAQHRKSRKAGLHDYGSPKSVISLKTIVYLMVESATVFTILMLCLTVLYEMQHAAVVIPHAMIGPCTSIVFVMMSVRIEAARRRMETHSSFTIPAMVMARTDTMSCATDTLAKPQGSTKCDATETQTSQGPSH